MADVLREQGPDTILGIVAQLESHPYKTKMKTGAFKEPLQGMLMEMAMGRGGLAEMSLQLRDATRLAYAECIDKEYRRRLADMSTSSGDDLEVLDLGYQLARLWALTSNITRAEEIFHQVLGGLVQESTEPPRMKKARRTHDPTNSSRVIRTTVALAEMLRNSQPERLDEVDALLLDTNPHGTLPVAFAGVSLQFLQSFLVECGSELDFLSTDACVERVLKPRTQRTLTCLVDTLDPDVLGERACFFVSHAWRQTFSVPESAPWRGGLAQALLDSTPEELWPDTFFWLDTFNVNQHLRSPSGGLVAFAFDPLRNAIQAADHVKLFMETWDDPAPLSRAWCLEEIRTALLLGKDVRVCMPSRAMAQFKKRATFETIERIVERVDISYATATFAEDLEYVRQRVESTIGTEALNTFCREIIRVALLHAAGIARIVQQTRSFKGTWDSVFESLLERSHLPTTSTPQAIEIRRAVAMMKRRMDTPASMWATQGAELLEETAELAVRYYGPSSQISIDITEQSTLAKLAEAEKYAAIIRQWQKSNDDAVEIYDTFSRHQISGSNVVDRIVALAKARGFDDGGKFLDMGCGTGALLQQLAARLPRASFVGVDPAERSLELARERCRGSNVEFLQGKVENLPAAFNDSTRFHVVLSTWGGFRWNRGGPVMEKLTAMGGITMMVHNWGAQDDWCRLWPRDGLAVFRERRNLLEQEGYHIERTHSILDLERADVFASISFLFGEEARLQMLFPTVLPLC